MGVCVYVYSIVYASTFYCVCTRVCIHVCLWLYVRMGVYVCEGQRLTLGVVDSLSFYLLRQGLIMIPELTSLASLASQLAPGNQSLPTGTRITDQPLQKPNF